MLSARPLTPTRRSVGPTVQAAFYFISTMLLESASPSWVRR